MTTMGRRHNGHKWSIAFYNPKEERRAHELVRVAQDKKRRTPRHENAPNSRYFQKGMG